MSVSKPMLKKRVKYQAQRIFSYNIQGLKNKLHYLNSIISGIKRKKPSVICLQEHFITVGSEDVLNSLEGYKCASTFCRQPGERGGGVCIMIKNQEDFEEISTLPSSTDIEITAIKHRNLIIVNVLNPYRRETLFFIKMAELFENLLKIYREEKVVIAGNFNINNLQKSGQAEVFRQLVKGYRFKMHVRTSTTKKGTCIDNFISNTKGGSAQIIKREWAFHFPIIGTFRTGELETSIDECNSHDSDETRTSQRVLTDRIKVLEMKSSEIDKAISFLVEKVFSAPSSSKESVIAKTMRKTENTTRALNFVSRSQILVNNDDNRTSNSKSSYEISKLPEKKGSKNAQEFLSQSSQKGCTQNKYEERISDKSPKRVLSDDGVKKEQYNIKKSRIDDAPSTPNTIHKIPAMNVFEKNHKGNYEPSEPSSGHVYFPKYTKQTQPRKPEIDTTLGGKKYQSMNPLKKLHENLNITIKSSPLNFKPSRVEPKLSLQKSSIDASSKFSKLENSICVDISSLEDEIRSDIHSFSIPSSQIFSNNSKQSSLIVYQYEENKPKLGAAQKHFKKKSTTSGYLKPLSLKSRKSTLQHPNMSSFTFRNRPNNGIANMFNARFSGDKGVEKLSNAATQTKSGSAAPLVTLPKKSLCNSSYIKKQQTAKVKNIFLNEKGTINSSNFVRTMNETPKLSSAQQDTGIFYINKNHVVPNDRKKSHSNDSVIKQTTVTEHSPVTKIYPLQIFFPPHQRASYFQRPCDSAETPSTLMSTESPKSSIPAAPSLPKTATTLEGEKNQSKDPSKILNKTSNTTMASSFSNLTNQIIKTNLKPPSLNPRKSTLKNSNGSSFTVRNQPNNSVANIFNARFSGSKGVEHLSNAAKRTNSGPSAPSETMPNQIFFRFNDIQQLKTIKVKTNTLNEEGETPSFNFVRTMKNSPKLRSTQQDAGISDVNKNHVVPKDKKLKKKLNSNDPVIKSTKVTKQSPVTNKYPLPTFLPPPQRAPYYERSHYSAEISSTLMSTESPKASIPAAPSSLPQLSNSNPQITTPHPRLTASSQLPLHQPQKSDPSIISDLQRKYNTPIEIKLIYSKQRIVPPNQSPREPDVSPRRVHNNKTGQPEVTIIV